MGVDLFEIKLHNLATGKQQKRQMDREQLRRAMPWLKRENALGSDVFIKPAEESGLVLLTGLTAQGLNQMHQEESTPAVTVEWSGNSFDAWVRVSDKPVPANILQVVGEQFAERYGASAERADGKSFGRLAGFTEQMARSGEKPYVLAHQGSGKVAPMGELAVQQVVAQLEKVRGAQFIAERAIRDRPTGRSNDRGMSL